VFELCANEVAAGGYDAVDGVIEGWGLAFNRSEDWQ